MNTSASGADVWIGDGTARDVVGIRYGALVLELREMKGTVMSEGKSGRRVS